MKLIKSVVNVIRIIGGTIFYICKYNRVNIAITCLAWAAIVTPSYLWHMFFDDTAHSNEEETILIILGWSLIACGSILIYFCVTWFVEQCRLYANKEKLR